MVMLKTQDYEDFSQINDTSHLTAVANGLIAREFSAAVRLPPLTYRPLLLAAFESAAPTLSAMADDGYRPWLFLANRPFTAEKIARLPHYSLSRPAADNGILTGECLEETSLEDGGLRTFGLYGVRGDRLADSCEFLTKQIGVVTLFSKRRDLLGAETVQELERTAGRAEDGRPAYDLNWIRAAMAFCPKGDIVLSTRGRFDDLDRSIVLAFDPACPDASRLFAPLGK